MTKREFKQAMLRGLGRCVIEINKIDDIEKYRDLVMWGCLHNLSYDSQAEGWRGEFMYVLQKKFADESFEDAVIEKFINSKGNPCQFKHYINMLYCFAFHGKEKSRNALFEKYEMMLREFINSKSYKRKDEFEWLCVWIVSLDGIDAFKKIVVDIGHVYIKKPKLSEFKFDWFYAASQNNCGKNHIKNYFEKQIPKSEEVRGFYNTVDDSKLDDGVNYLDEKITVKDVIEASRRPLNECRRTIYRFARTSSKEERLELANAAVSEENENSKANMLLVFKMKEFPLEIEIIIDASKSNNENLSRRAFELLAEIKDKRVREYALELIYQDRNLEYALMILFSNYENQDAELVYKMLKQIKVGYKDKLWHDIYCNAIKWIENDKSVPEKIILYLYENTLCAYCRENIVMVMSKRRMLKGALLKECLNDSNWDIRRFARKKLKSLKTKKKKGMLASD